MPRSGWIAACCFFLFGCFTIVWRDFSSERHHSPEEQRPVTLNITESSFIDDLRNGRLSGSDPRVLHYIRTHMARPSGLPINLADKSGTKDFSIKGTSAFADKLLNGKRGGFFIECGGADGETVSNSLFFELERSWTGLLIELNPASYNKILSKHRNVYALNACLSVRKAPSMLKVRLAGLSGGIDAEMTNVQQQVSFIKSSGTAEVLCFPLNSIMEAMRITTVDFMSLDVEGAESSILKTVDFKSLNIQVLVVEVDVQGHGQPAPEVMKAHLEKLAAVRDVMQSTGLYKEVALLPIGSTDANAHDAVFQRL